jgi:hypothetical protein
MRQALVLLTPLILGGTLANAQVTYTYASTPFNYFVGEYSCTGGVGECSVSGTFTLPAPLPANLNLPTNGPSYSFAPPSYSFTDGVNVLNQNNTSPSCGYACSQPAFNIWATDANGLPTLWNFQIQTGGFCPRSTIQTAALPGGIDESYRYDADCNLLADAATDDGQGNGIPGTWMVSVSATKTWSTYLPVLLPAYVASTLTPNADITVSRIQAHVIVPPDACKTNGVIQLSNGTSTGTLVVSSADNDSGPIAIPFRASVPVTVSVITPSQCFIPPSLVNFVVQYGP